MPQSYQIMHIHLRYKTKESSETFEYKQNMSKSLN